ncbi:MAG: hypothetical protein RMK52_08785 [Chitinophagales bacterium]|nr:hypothetical protein [Chitinophagales bacterium]MDW8394322.1 hypothetical protein [Chitinophagales bacterium]
MNRFAFALLLVLLTIKAGQGQSDLDAVTAITRLRHGLLLVRLPSPTARLQALEQAGQTQRAEQVRRQYEEQNQLIADAFREEFHFCRYLFVFSDAMAALLEGRRAGIFLNAALQPDSSLAIGDTFFLIATIGRPVLYGSHTGSRNNGMPQPSLFGEALVIHDASLRQLTDPFPFSAREDFITHLFGGDWRKKVRNLNQRLFAFADAVGQQ